MCMQPQKQEKSMRTRVIITPIMLISIFLSVLAQDEQTITLAVSDLVPQGIKESEAMVISEQLRTELLKNPRIRMIERAQMEAIMKEKGLAQGGVTSDDEALAVGKLLGVGNIVVGSIGNAGSYTLLTVRVLDVKTGMVVTNDAVKTKGGVNEILDQGITIVSRNLSNDLFGNETEPNNAQIKRKDGNGKLLAIGGTGALLIGGGVAAFFLLNRNPAKETPTHNVEIVLP